MHRPPPPGRTQAMDRFGNKQRFGGDPFQVKVDGSSDVDAEIVDHGDGMPASHARAVGY